MNANGDRYDYWLSQHIARMKSGQSIPEFCKNRGINASTFRQAVSRYGFDEKASKGDERDFIELTSNDSVDSCILEVDFRGCRIRFFRGVEARFLGETLKVLGVLI